MDSSQHETDAQGAGEPATVGGQGNGPGGTLDGATSLWKRRGYRVLYRDEYLVQLVRRAWPVTAVTLVTLAALGAMVFAWRMGRSWYVVSVAVGPDGRVVSHRKRFDHPPKV